MGVGLRLVAPHNLSPQSTCKTPQHEMSQLRALKSHLTSSKALTHWSWPMGSRAGAAGQAVSADGTSLPQLDAPLQMCASLELPRARGWFYGLEAAVPSRQETMCKGLIVNQGISGLACSVPMCQGL